MVALYLNDWAGAGLDEVLRSFDAHLEQSEIDSMEILIADYRYEDYEGSAWVLFRKDGKLFEVNGGHCSCYELEGQWEPEETTVEALKHRLEKGALGYERETEVRALLQNLS